MSAIMAIKSLRPAVGLFSAKLRPAHSLCQWNVLSSFFGVNTRTESFGEAKLQHYFHPSMQRKSYVKKDRHTTRMKDPRKTGKEKSFNGHSFKRSLRTIFPTKNAPNRQLIHLFSVPLAATHNQEQINSLFSLKYTVFFTLNLRKLCFV